MPEHGHDDPRVRAWKQLAEHRWWPYRSCAPENTAADTGSNVWLTPDRESQPARFAREAAAVAECARCPVRAACLGYALGDASGPYEEWNVWGGMTAHQRAELLASRAAQDSTPRREQIDLTDLDTAVLKALAAHRSPAAVAAAAGMTLARANWHRSRLVTLLHLDPRTTTRMRLIYTARLLGLIDPAAPYLADRTRLIAAVPSRQPALNRSRPVQLPLPDRYLRLFVPLPADTGAGTVTALPAPADGAELEMVA
jgi:WhiB family redox-sensing transcriptional regulator